MRVVIIILIGLATIGCQRLDNFLFNPNTDLAAYELDDFTLDNDSFFKLDASYDIPDSLISVFILPTSGENAIYAVYIGDQNRIATDTVILYNHGNTGHIDYYWQRAKLLANAGGKNRFGVLMIDYQGYGLSEGSASEENLYDDVDRAQRWLKAMGLSDNRLVMYGFSLGTAPSTKLCSTPRSMRANKIILEAPFASADVMVQDGGVIAIPGSFLTNLEIDNAEEIKKVQQPFLWIHGTDDDFIDLETHGEVVYKNHGGISKTALRVVGGEHSTCPQTHGFEAYNQVVVDFITRN